MEILFFLGDNFFLWNQKKSVVKGNIKDWVFIFCIKSLRDLSKLFDKFFSLTPLNYFFQLFNLWRRCKACTFSIIFNTASKSFSNDGLFQPLLFVITQLGKNERSLWKILGIQSWLLDIGLFVCATLLVQNLARGLQGFVNKNTFRPAEKKTPQSKLT